MRTGLAVNRPDFTLLDVNFCTGFCSNITVDTVVPFARQHLVLFLWGAVSSWSPNPKWLSCYLHDRCCLHEVYAWETVMPYVLLYSLALRAIIWLLSDSLMRLWAPWENNIRFCSSLCALYLTHLGQFCMSVVYVLGWGKACKFCLPHCRNCRLCPLVTSYCLVVCPKTTMETRHRITTLSCRHQAHMLWNLLPPTSCLLLSSFQN